MKKNNVQKNSNSSYDPRRRPRCPCRRPRRPSLRNQCMIFGEESLKNETHIEKEKSCGIIKIKKYG